MSAVWAAFRGDLERPVRSGTERNGDDMKIAVLGATGTAGSRVVRRLKDENVDVVAVSRASGVDLVTGDGLVDHALIGRNDRITEPCAIKVTKGCECTRGRNGHDSDRYNECLHLEVL